jgi:PAS domain S-box-containing protein/putative nucleotidyltransferase with HDIG domain
MDPMTHERTVLLVEDNPGDARLIAETLRDAGSTMRLVTVETLAIAIATVQREDIDAIVLDLGLPDSQGVETFLRLDEAAPSVATVIMSGDNDTRTAIEAVQRGAQDFLVKGQAGGELLLRAISYAIERKHAEALVAESEEKFRYLFDRSIVAKSITRPTGEIEVNAALCSMLGYTPEELADGATWQTLTHPDDVAATQRQMQALIAGETTSARYEKRFLRKDGVIVWADISSSLRRDAAGQPLYFMTSALDITERKRAEEELRASEERLRRNLEVSESIAELSRTLVAETQSIVEIAHLTLEYAMTLTESEYGYVSVIDPETHANNLLAVRTMMPDEGPALPTRGETSPLSLPEIGHYPHLWGVSLNTERPFLTNDPGADAASHGTPVGHVPLTAYLSVPVSTKDGVVGQIAVANAPGGYADDDARALERLASVYAVAIVQGSEHAALRQSEEDLRSAQAVARMAPFVVDMPAGTWASSEALDRVFGIDAKYQRNVSGLLALIHEDDRDKLHDYIHAEASAARNTPVQLDSEFRMIRPDDGRTIWIQAHWALERTPEGVPARFVGVVQDVTLRHEAQEAMVASNESLQRMIRDVAEVMGGIIETRDPYTQGHQVRVAAIANALAVEMGLSDDDLDCIQMAALLHDIGKLSVPAEILSKPGKLSEVEFALIREHPVRGHAILSRIAFPWPIADIVLQHHERSDGSGYPAGLKESETLLPARILAVADVLEAMASYRPYRPSLGADAAIDEIATHPDKYCADVVSAALVLYERSELGI